MELMLREFGHGGTTVLPPRLRADLEVDVRWRTDSSTGRSAFSTTGNRQMRRRSVGWHQERATQPANELRSRASARGAAHMFGDRTEEESEEPLSVVQGCMVDRFLQ